MLYFGLHKGRGEQKIFFFHHFNTVFMGGVKKCLKMCLRNVLMTSKKSAGLQLRVVMCLIILVGVRVTNVFVPIYSKKIVDALTEKIFAWQLILAFVGLKLLQG